MPPMPRTVPIGISFDAQNTLVEILGGIGQQYFRHFRRFLQNKGFAIEDAMPSCTATSLNTTSYTILRYAVNQDREAWVTAHPEAKDRKEMPIGGRTEASITQFWRRAVTDVFKSPSLYLSTPPRLKQSLLDVMEGEEWEEFLNQVVQNFASSDCYGWLPEGLRTLEDLRQWSMEQEKLAYQPPRHGNHSSPHGAVGQQRGSVLVLAAPPFVVTNSDFRMKWVFKELGAFNSTSPASTTSWSSGKKMPPLLGKVITAAEMGYAKPSPKGILHCLRECGLERFPDRFIHVGDSEDDEAACRSAGCRFLQCHMNTGVQWEKLKTVIDEVAKDIQESR